MIETDSTEFRDRVINEIRRRWIAPVSCDKAYRVAAGSSDAVAKKALDAMLVRDFRITPYPPQDEYDQLLSRVAYWVGQ